MGTQADHNPSERHLTIQVSPDEARTVGIEKGQEVWVGLKDYHLLQAADSR